MKPLTGKGKPFHSALDKAAGLLKRKVGTGAEFMKELQGLGGIKQAEIDERKLAALMGMPKMTHEQFMSELAARPLPAIRDKVLSNPTGDEVNAAVNAKIEKNEAEELKAQGMSPKEIKQELEGYADRVQKNNPGVWDQIWRNTYADMNKNPTAHDKWTLPGGENYREMLIKAPKGHEGFEGVGAHFRGEPNILASMRLKDRMTPEGQKLLHLEELQSDWHQQGREKGYRTQDVEKRRQELLKAASPYIDSNRAIPKEIYDELTSLPDNSAPPDAPFKKNWEEMALKRLLHHAAEKGYHGIVMTPGAEQADRYSLAKQVDRIAWQKQPDGTFSIQAIKGDDEHNSNEVLSKDKLNKEQLAELIGKDAASKINENSGQHAMGTLSGLDLQVGGEGMKAFYDKKLPNILNAIGKKHKVKTQLHGHHIETHPARTEEQLAAPGIGHFPEPIVHPAQTKAVHHFPITEDMRKDILTNGLPLYAEGGIIHKAEGGPVQLSVEQMRQQLMAAGKPLQDISQIGAEEAPDMNVKSFVMPSNGAQGPMPVGGVDMNPQQPGQQMLPANLLQPQPQQQQQQPQGAPAPLGGAGPAPAGGSNILQMTPQGQKMAALGGGQPPAPPAPIQKATGGPVPGPQPVHNYPFQASAQKPLPFLAKEGGSDNAPMNNDYSDNGATDFDIDNIQQLAKGGQPKKSLHYAPAPALSKAQIEAMAERMARQVSGLDNPNAKTLQQLAREQNLPLEIKGSKKMDVPVINYENLKGSYSVGVPGDTSRGGVKPGRRAAMSPVKAGEYLHGIGGEKLESPVPLYGGKDYGAFGHPEGWASDLGASAGMFNVVKKLAEENPEREVYGHYHKMSPEALNHALHMLDAVLSYHKPHAAPAERIAMLNDLMRNKTTTTSKHDVPYPEFPGFDKPEDIMLQAALNSGMRKKIIGMLGKEKYFPGGKQKLDDVIYAISHPELRNIETGAGGSSIIKFDPNRELRESVSPHPTYGHDIPSRLVGKTRYITPAEILAPRSMANAAREIKAMGKKVVPFNQAKMNIIREPIDEQFINQIGQYEHAMKKRLGYKKGGKVKLSTNMDTINLELSKSRKKAK